MKRNTEIRIRVGVPRKNYIQDTESCVHVHVCVYIETVKIEKKKLAKLPK